MQGRSVPEYFEQPYREYNLFCNLFSIQMLKSIIEIWKNPFLILLKQRLKGFLDKL